MISSPTDTAPDQTPFSDHPPLEVDCDPEVVPGTVLFSVYSYYNDAMCDAEFQVFCPTCLLLEEVLAYGYIYPCFGSPDQIYGLAKNFALATTLDEHNDRPESSTTFPCAEPHLADSTIVATVTFIDGSTMCAARGADAEWHATQSGCFAYAWE